MTTDYSQVPIIQCSYRLVLETLQLVAHFPKNHRYQIGDRLAALTQEFFEQVIKANLTRDAGRRWRMLDDLSATLFTVRMLIRLCKELKIISIGQYTVLNAAVEDIQKQLTGWSKWTQSKISTKGGATTYSGAPPP